MSEEFNLAAERVGFHRSLCESLLFFNQKTSGGLPYRVASNADGSQNASREIANRIAEQLGAADGKPLAGQTSGNRFEQIVKDFLDRTFLRFEHLRPGKWSIDHMTARSGAHLADFDQFHHLAHVTASARSDPELLASLGNDYTISPDLIVRREPESDETVFGSAPPSVASLAGAASIRKQTARGDQMHASVSCKWTMRSDRAQNARSEALNLIRNRKGRTPHIVAVVGEPTPSRIASLALGTGDLDCVYHFALPELKEAVRDFGEEEALNLLNVMIDGRRLKDISDLPLDLCV
jgi:hypothetical protein